MEEDPGRKRLSPPHALRISKDPTSLKISNDSIVLEPSIPEVVKEIVLLSRREIPLLKGVYWRSDGKEIWPVFESHDREQLFRLFTWERELRRRAIDSGFPLDLDINCLIRDLFLPDRFPGEENLPMDINYLRWAPWSK